MSEEEDAAATGGSVTVLDSLTPPPERKKELVIGGLRLRSTPGACFILSGVLLLVGLGIAVGGYWPHRPKRQAPPIPSAGRDYEGRLKLVGPIIMGFGLFVFICANTLLYENRDRERKQDKEQKKNTPPKQRRKHRRTNSEKWRDAQAQEKMHTNTHTLALSELNIHSVEEGAGLPVLKCPSPSSDSCNSSQVTFDIQTESPPTKRKSTTDLTPPLIKLNNCLIGFPNTEAPPLPPRTYKTRMGGANLSTEGPTQINHFDSRPIREATGKERIRIEKH